MSDSIESTPNDFALQLVKLEEKLSFQQRTIDELNSVVLSQQSEIDCLRKELKTLQTVTQTLAERGLGEDLPHEKPPHY